MYALQNVDIRRCSDYVISTFAEYALWYVGRRGLAKRILLCHENCERTASICQIRQT